MRPYRLTRQLSELTGESLTSAITEAVRERLERVGRERGVDLISFEKLGVRTYTRCTFEKITVTEPPNQYLHFDVGVQTQDNTTYNCRSAKRTHSRRELISYIAGLRRNIVRGQLSVAALA